MPGRLVAAELTALADGSLAPEDRAALERQVAESAELRAALEDQRRALRLLRDVAADTQAPLGLRQGLEARRVRSPAQRRRAWGWPIGLAIAVAAATVVALLVTVPDGTPQAPSVLAFTALTVGATKKPVSDPVSRAPLPRPSAQAGAPAAAASHRRRAPTPRPTIARAVAGVAFPSRRERYGWKATGARDDRLRGRSAATVFYERSGRRIGLTIVDGDPLRIPANSRLLRRRGTRFAVIELAGGPTAVTWLRDGHTAILSGRDVTLETLLTLASA